MSGVRDDDQGPGADPPRPPPLIVTPGGAGRTPPGVTVRGGGRGGDRPRALVVVSDTLTCARCAVSGPKVPGTVPDGPRWRAVFGASVVGGLPSALSGPPDGLWSRLCHSGSSRPGETGLFRGHLGHPLRPPDRSCAEGTERLSDTFYVHQDRAGHSPMLRMAVPSRRRPPAPRGS